MSIWGKVIGGVTGLAIGGPIGAIIGAVAGHHVVDKKAKAAADLGSEEKQIAFTTAIIVLAAKMAKADGVVTRDEIEAFKEIFHIPKDERATVGQIFDRAKNSADGFEPYAEQVGAMFRKDQIVLEELMGALFHIAKADGEIHPSEVQYLRRVALLFGFSERDFHRLQMMHAAGFGEQGRAGGPSSPGDIAAAYEVLKVDPSASDDEVKAAHRKLVRENHPDILTAKGLPQEFIDLANDKLAAINDAYDRVKKVRGIT